MIAGKSIILNYYKHRCVIALESPAAKPSLTLCGISYRKSISTLSQDELHKVSNRVIQTYSKQARKSDLLFSKTQCYVNHSKSLQVSSTISQEISNYLTHSSCTQRSLAVPASRNIYITDNFYDKSKCQKLCSLIQQSELQYLFTSVGERKLSMSNIDCELSESVVGERAHAIIYHLKNELKNHLQQTVLSGKQVTEEGSILSWLCPPTSTHDSSSTSSGTSNDNRSTAVSQSSWFSPFITRTLSHTHTHSSPVPNSLYTEYTYWSSHCDKANNFNYDYSVLLYLNADFQGGNLIMIDDEIDNCIEIKASRVIVFESSITNIHRVEPVVAGNRLLLSVWFSSNQIC